MAKRGIIPWTLEILTQLLFYSLPALIDIPAYLHYSAEQHFNGNYKAMIGIYILLTFNLAWIIPNLFYFILYRIQHPFFEKYRSQDWVWNEEDSPRRTAYMSVVRATLVKFIVNQVIISVFIYFAAIRVMSHTDDMEHIKAYIDSAPSAFEGFLKMMAGFVLFETIFYWAHVWLHTPMGYKYHKDHHAYYAPISITGQWGSTIDGLVSLPFPAFFPVYVLNMHFITVMFYAVAHVFHSQYDHAGYHFPYNPFQLIPFASHSDAHNFHHSHSVDNFGLYFRFWDVIMGTNKHWEKFKADRDALLENKAEGETQDFYMVDGHAYFKRLAEKQHLDAGEDNLQFTLQNQEVHVNGNKEFIADEKTHKTLQVERTHGGKSSGSSSSTSSMAKED